MKIGERVLPRGILLATALAAVALAGCPRVPETQRPSPTPIGTSGEPRPPYIKTETDKDFVLFRSPAHSYQIEYPRDWRVSEGSKGGNDSFESPGEGGISAGSHIFIGSIDTPKAEIQRFIDEKMVFYEGRMHEHAKEGKVSTSKNKVGEYYIARFDFESEPMDNITFVVIASSSKIWTIQFGSFREFTDRDQPKFEKMLRSFKGEKGERIEPPVQALKKPVAPTASQAEAQKPAGGEKVAIRLKPEELYRKLLTTPIANELPPGFTAGGNQPFDLAVEDRAFGAIGKVIMAIGVTNGSGDFGEIKYTLFPDTSAAKAAYDMLATRYNSHHLPDLDHPVLVQSISGGTVSYPQSLFMSIVLIENVLVTTSRNGPFDQAAQEKRAIAVTKSAIAHLQRVGR